MITADSISLGEAIAVPLGDHIRTPGVLVAGLAEASYSSAGYSDTGFRKEIVEFTHNDPVHSVLVDELSTRLAEGIRDSFHNIKTYGVGLASAISEKTYLLYTPNRVRDVAHANLKVQFINVDDQFFESNLFPTAVKNNSFTYASVGLDVLDRLSFNYTSQPDLVEYINSTHPDVLFILNNPGWELYEAGNAIMYLSGLKELFVHDGNTFDFTRIKSTDIDRLLKIYLIVTKMANSDEPVAWLEKGTLQDYREYVNLLYDGMTTYLIRLKSLVNTYKSQGVTVFVNKSVVMGPSTNSDFKDVTVMTGNLTVFYTDTALMSIEDAGVSFLEWVYAHQMARLKGLNINTTSLITDKPRVDQLLGEYYGQINKVLVGKALEHFKRSAGEATHAFVVSHPELTDRIRQLAGEGCIPADWVVGVMHDEFIRAYHTLAAADTFTGEAVIADNTTRGHLLNLLISKTLVPSFLRVIGANMAAEIMEDTYQTESSTPSEVQLRERLTISVINLLARKTWS